MTNTMTYRANMRLAMRYLFLLPVALNIVIILVRMDILMDPTPEEVLSNPILKYLKRKRSRLFEAGITPIYKNLMNFTYISTVGLENYSEENPKVVLLYNVKRNIIVSPRHQANQTQAQKCEFTNCVITRDKTKLLTADAIIFNIGVRIERIGLDPPVRKESRNPDQVWIFTGIGSPDDYLNTDYESVTWHNTMNWSLLYRLDSDIPSPYGSLVENPNPPELDYESIYNAKTKNALWLVRQCQSASGRRQYINEMMKYGFEVDMLGICGVDGKEIELETLEEMIPTYKFFLAFETSLCNDYVTERFFRNYNYNWVLVVRGGADYRRLLPTDTYVDASDFPSINLLVDYLNELANDKEKYINFLRKKNQYKGIIRGPDGALCEMCKRLNNLDRFRNMYGRITDYVDYDQCIRPIDL